MSQSATVSLYHRTLRQDQTITHSIAGHFTNPRAVEFVVVRGSILELLRFDDATERLNSIFSTDTHSFILDIRPIRVDKIDFIVIASDSGTLTIVQVEPSSGVFQTVVSQVYGRSGIRRSSPGHYLAVDPQGQSIILSSLEHNKIAYKLTHEMSVDDNNQPHYTLTLGGGVQARNTAHQSSYVTYSLTALHVPAEASPSYAAIEARYDTVDPTPFALDKAHHMSNPIISKQLTFYVHDTGLRRCLTAYSIPIPSSASSLVAVPYNLMYPGGVIVFCENCALYYPYDAYTSISRVQDNDIYTRGILIQYPVRNTSTDSPVMIITSTVISRVKAKSIICLIFAQTEHGDIFKIDLTMLHNDLKLIRQQQLTNIVQSLKITYYDTLPPCTTICISDTGRILATPESSDTIILGLGSDEPPYTYTESYPSDIVLHTYPLHDGQIDTNIPSLHALHSSDVDQSQYIYAPCPITRFQYISSLTSLAPLRASTLYQNYNHVNITQSTPSTPDITLYNGIGSGPRSYITANKIGIKYSLLGHQTLDGTPTRLFKAHIDTSIYDAVCLLSTSNSSMLFSVYQNGLNNITTPGFIYDQQTLTFGHIAHSNNLDYDSTTDLSTVCSWNVALPMSGIAMIQVTPTHVVGLVASKSTTTPPQITNAVLRWDPGALTITAADMNTHYVAIALSTQIKILSIQHNTWHEVASLETGRSLTHISIMNQHQYTDGSLPQSSGPFGDALIATASKDNTIRLWAIHKIHGQNEIEELSFHIMDHPIQSIIFIDNIHSYNLYVFSRHCVTTLEIDAEGQVTHITQHNNNISNAQLATVRSATNDDQCDVILCSSQPQVLRQHNWYNLHLVTDILPDYDNEVKSYNMNRSHKIILPECQPKQTTLTALNYLVAVNTLHQAQLFIGLSGQNLLIATESGGHSLTNLTNLLAVKDNTIPQSSRAENIAITHAARVTYTPRQIHHIDVAHLCREYGITHTPQTYPPLSKAQDGQEPIIHTVTPNDVIAHGTHTLSQQQGQLLISVEGDNMMLDSKTHSKLYAQAYTNDNEHVNNTTISMSNSHVSNTAGLSGSNSYEFNVGYIPGTTYQGCIRLINPSTFETYHALSLPAGMTITSSTVAVLGTSTCLVVGGYSLEIEQSSSYDANDTDDTLQSSSPRVHRVGNIVTYLLTNYRGVWCADFYHVTRNALPVMALSSLKFSPNALLAGLGDGLAILELGKRQLLFKGKISTTRGIISTITPTDIFETIDHTQRKCTIVYVGHHGQGHSMIRIVLLTPPPPPTGISATGVSQPPPMEQVYALSVLCNSEEHRYSLSSSPVQGGFIGGDRFGNIYLTAIDHNDCVSMLTDPTYPTNMTPSEQQTIEQLQRPGLRIYAESFVGAPVTNIFTVQLHPGQYLQRLQSMRTSSSSTASNMVASSALNNQQMIIYTTLTGSIGVLRPLVSAITSTALNTILTQMSSLSLTNSGLNQWKGYFMPSINVIHGNELIEYLRLALPTPTRPHVNETIELILTTIAQESGLEFRDLIQQCFRIDTVTLK